MDTTETAAAPEAPRPRRWPNRAKWMAVGGVAALAATAAGVAGAVAGFGGPRFGGFAEHRLERALDAIDATPEQEKKLWAIVDEARGEMRPMMRDFRDARERLTVALAGPTVDRDAVEKIRAERIAAIDAASKKAAAAMVDAAETLTPEQRATLAKTMKDHGPHRP